MAGTWWAFLTSAPAGSSLLAFVTTLHCALLVLRRHRSPASPLLLLPSLALTASPWILSTPAWLLACLGTHLLWFLACERFAQARTQSPTRSRIAADPAPKQPARAAFVPLRVLAVIEETAEIRTFRFERPPGFTFQPGQFAMVRVPVSGKDQVRCYSICSSPDSDYLEISVRRQGAVSAALHAAVTPGGNLYVRGPGGPFVHQKGARPLVLLAGGIGITPLRSMLLHTLAHEPQRDVTLLLSARTFDAVPFHDELRALARRHPQFRLAVTLSRDEARAGCESGRIDRALLEQFVTAPAASVFMLCGPGPMIEEMRELLGACGVPPAHVHYEKFEAAVAGAASAGSSERFRMTLEPSGRAFQLSAGQTILDAAEGAGIAIPSMCRAGACGTCRTRVVDGHVEGDTEALDPAERAAGWVLACVSRPTGPCRLEIAG
jgi:ferredoxin-NADP reductase